MLSRFRLFALLSLIASLGACAIVPSGPYYAEPHLMAPPPRIIYERPAFYGPAPAIMIPAPRHPHHHHDERRGWGRW